MRRYSLIEHMLRGEDARYNLGGSMVPPLTIEELGIENSDISTGYGSVHGRTDLRERFASRFDVDVGQVIITGGAHEANNVAFFNCISGGKVLVEEPFFEPLRNVPEGFGSQVVTARRDRMTEAIESGSFEMVVICNPNNPTGDRSDISDIHRTAVESGAVVLIDEIYRPFVGEKSSINAVGEGTIVTCSLSKIGGLGGARVGWLVSTPDLAPELRRTKENLNPTNNNFGELAAMAFLNDHDRHIQRARDLVAEGEGLLSDALAGFNVSRTGMPFAYLRYGTGPSSIEVAERLMKEWSVLLYAGEHFGDSGAFRIATGCHDREGYSVLAGALDAMGVGPL
jgi:aspartate/methionine/tyrosine aminotransferase